MHYKINIIIGLRGNYSRQKEAKIGNQIVATINIYGLVYATIWLHIIHFEGAVYAGNMGREKRGAQRVLGSVVRTADGWPIHAPSYISA